MAWQIDNSHSSIDFSVRHMMISKVRGRFGSFAGAVDLNVDNPELTTVNVQIDAASIDTSDEKRDAHLRSPDFLNAPAYPQLLFSSTQVERTGKSTANLHGDLTIRNVTRPVVLDVTYVGNSQSPWGAQVYGFEAALKINRKEWGLEWNVALETGGVLVGEDISITIQLELVRIEEAQAVAVAG